MSQEKTTEFVSGLPSANARFLAEAVEHGLRCGRRTSGDFLRHFPAGAIMQALDAAPQRRAELLTELVGVRERTALRIGTSEGGRMLQAALEEGDCDGDAIVRVPSPDE